MKVHIRSLIDQMTLEEKAGLCSGLDFWNTKGIERLGIPSLMVTDGPHGLRKQKEGADHLGLHNSVPATCFPSAAGMASSWNRELIGQVGKALGEESQAENVAVLLGPGVNIKRSPLCGRNFEYFSEDPFLSSEMAAHHIKGVQSQGVGTSLKHFAANNQEHRRMSVDAVIDERTLREIYLASFEGAVKQSQPWSVMCAYNRVNGEYASENEYLLTKILRDEWGFEGFVVSDWGAVNERVKALVAGLELEMPSSTGIGDAKLVAAVRSGELPEETLNLAVERLLTFIFKAVDNRKPGAAYDPEAHHALARKMAEESMVLLKNEDGILPLRKQGKIAVIGEFAKNPRYQGGGSSHVNPTKLDDALEEMEAIAGASVAFMYAQGYKLESDDIDDLLVAEARETAGKGDAAVLFIGLPDRYESEGYDRTHMEIPDNHRALIEAVSEVQPNLVVVLSNGSPVEMPWIGKVKAVLEGYLGGQAFGGAVAALLLGEANPSGKLAETFPVKLSDNPSYLNFPGEGDKVEYKEGLFVGYRYYDKKEVEPLFPFGHGLSYTRFEYSDLKVDKQSLMDNEKLQVSVTVANAGGRAGKEIVQLYVRDVESSVIRPQKELKGFAKVELQQGERKTVTFELDKRAFAYYNVERKDWHVETGTFELLVGQSSREIVLSAAVEVESSEPLAVVFDRNTNIGDLMANPRTAGKANAFIANFGLEEALGDNPEMFLAMMRYMPLRAMIGFGQGKYTEEMLARDLAELNGLAALTS
ncbi:glycosyl hydrolase family 3 [Paenibacillus darwinianus]|uniref:Glycosyl hydrolase family 3 n=1 Tax=Paenibacillus darwinianus TaxID=1380763 RepID=A0A9W5RZJ2_9BACL|nr:glycoside hydrolase family 3 C-terminal domain-containing protein [Paenibacillus darwinianus]EXX86767.1 glycosyl hydrolase family 3 [Paenibacillus darwinianus]EXX87079.1 glycosyl hydrolase family 3 [Paenibacillus darwinianus]EXX87283.1 glycosyl hydrolase family 3 [Paenibacillus darwinianus]